MVSNVGTGNSAERPDHPREQRTAWRFTWIVVVAFVIFVVLFIGLGRMRSSARTSDTPTQPRQSSSRVHDARPVVAQFPRT